MSIEDKFLKARAKLLMEQPFFGTLALRLKVIESEECDTAATDGTRLLYNAKFIDKLSPHELVGLIAHEVMHCVFNHMTRRQERLPNAWNVACDYAINDHLLKCNFMLPEGGCVDTEGKFDGMTAEAIYQHLLDNGDSKIIVMPAWGLVMDAGSGTVNAESGAALESDWQVAINQAAELAKAQGKLPGHIEAAVSEVLQPLVDWRSVLWPFFNNIRHDEYSWRKPNRAYISEDEYLPSMYNESTGTIAICVDTSGSVSDAELHQFWSEIVAVAKETQPAKIICVGCDSQVNDIFEWGDSETFWDEPPTFTGRGGTLFSPAFEKLNELQEDIEACVYLTDLGSNDFGDEPHYPVLWISTDKRAGEAPWGETIYMKLQS